jgi:hypothetical protein
MRIGFWTLRFCLAASIGFVLLGAVYLARGRPPRQALTEALIWGCISAAVFITARIYHLSRGRACALCNDSPPPVQ